jgi:hypothetical protein
MTEVPESHPLSRLRHGGCFWARLPTHQLEHGVVQGSLLRQLAKPATAATPIRSATQYLDLMSTAFSRNATVGARSLCVRQYRVEQHAEALQDWVAALPVAV